LGQTQLGMLHVDVFEIRWIPPEMMKMCFGTTRYCPACEPSSDVSTANCKYDVQWDSIHHYEERNDLQHSHTRHIAVHPGKLTSVLPPFDFCITSLTHSRGTDGNTMRLIIQAMYDDLSMVSTRVESSTIERLKLVFSRLP
jgi:hypothetical protein